MKLPRFSVRAAMVAAAIIALVLAAVIEQVNQVARIIGDKGCELAMKSTGPK